MDLQKMSQSLLKSLVAVAVSLGEVAATVAGSMGDVELKGSRESLWERLKAFTSHLQKNLRGFADTVSGKAPDKPKTTPGVTRASMTSAASAWQALVTDAVDEWIQMTTEAIEVLDACTATAEGGNAAEATKWAKDLQKKVVNWLNALKNQVDKTRQLPWVTNKEKADAALKDYEARVKEAKENTLEALTDMVIAMVVTSQMRAAAQTAQQAENVLKPLGRLVVACGAAAAIFQDLRRAVGAIQDTLEGTKEESSDVPKDLVAEVKQVEQLWETSEELVDVHLDVVTGDIRKLIPGGTSYKGVSDKCQKAIEYIQSKE